MLQIIAHNLLQSKLQISLEADFLIDLFESLWRQQLSALCHFEETRRLRRLFSIFHLLFFGRKFLHFIAKTGRKEVQIPGGGVNHHKLHLYGMREILLSALLEQFPRAVDGRLAHLVSSIWFAQVEEHDKIVINWIIHFIYFDLAYFLPLLDIFDVYFHFIIIHVN